MSNTRPQPQTEDKAKEPVSRFITIIRPEFMTFCQDACRSAALNHLLFRIAYKAKDQPKEKIQAGQVLWYAKTDLITSEMSNAWGVCKVRKEVNELVAMNLFGRRSNPTWGSDRTKHFCFGAEQCKVLIDLCETNGVCLIHLGIPAEVVHLIYSANANDKSIKCSCPAEDANDKSIRPFDRFIRSSDKFIKPSDESIRAFTKNTTKNNNKDTSKERESGANPQNSQTSAGGSAIASPAHAFAFLFSSSQSSEGELNEPHHHPASVSHRGTNIDADAGDLAGVNPIRPDNDLEGASGDPQRAATTGPEADQHPTAPSQAVTPSVSYSPALSETQPVEVTAGAADYTKRVSNGGKGSSKEKVSDKVEQLGLPLTQDIGPLVMPAENAPWLAGTLLLISEVLRGRRYTDNQRKGEVEAAKKMLKEFPALTRELFIEAFLDRKNWNADHSQPLVSVHYLMQKGYKSNDLRMQQTLDILEQKRGKTVQSGGQAQSRSASQKSPMSWADPGYNQDDDFYGNGNSPTWAEIGSEENLYATA